MHLLLNGPGARVDADARRAHRDMDETHWWFRGRRRVIEAMLERYVPAVEGPVLDVGCGAGGLLDVVGKYGPVAGIEGDPVLAAAAAERHPAADVRVGQLPEAVESASGCKIVSAFDVIEHVDDDVALLRAMVGALGPEGIVCVTVPALQLLWSSHDDANGHKRRYRARTLSASLDAAGLDVVHLSYFNTLLLPLVAAVRLSERLGRTSPGTDFDQPAGGLDSVLAMVLGSERYLVPRARVPIGVSLIAVATVR